MREIAAAEFGINHTLIDAPLNGAFLTFSDGCGVQLWSLAGQRVARLAGPGWLAGDAWATLFLSRGQDLLLAYCQGQGCAGRTGRPDGAAQQQQQEQSPRVVVWDVLRGRQAAVVAPPEQGPSGDGGLVAKASAAATERAAAALAHVRTIFYDEARQELLLGTAHGHVHVWG